MEEVLGDPSSKTMIDFVHRPATVADAPRVADLMLLSRRTFLSYLPSPRSDEEIRRWIGGVLIPRGGVTLAEGKDHELLGIMALSFDGEYSWVEQLFIAPPVVGQGIGSRLLKLALAHLQPPVRLYTFQANERARRFYEKHGFQAIRFTDGEANEERWPDVLYEWRGNA
jgi:RimJ/RimL family protein N-acetyltransferase